MAILLLYVFGLSIAGIELFRTLKRPRQRWVLASLSLLVLGGCAYHHFFVKPKSYLRGCNTTYFAKYYGNKHRLAAIEGAPYALMAHNAYSAERKVHFVLPTGYVDMPFEFDTGNSDMAFRLYAYQPNGTMEKLVLAFRGTDSVWDWWNGTINGEQYDLALALAKRVRHTYPSVPLLTTGHSLGGGLALHVSLQMQGVTAYAFNPSPLTRAPDARVKNRRVIYWEENDVLHYGRWAWQKTPDANYWKYNFLADGGHNSLAMSKGLLMVAAVMSGSARADLQQNCSIAP